MLVASNTRFCAPTTLQSTQLPRRTLAALVTVPRCVTRLLVVLVLLGMAAFARSSSLLVSMFLVLSRFEVLNFWLWVMMGLITANDGFIMGKRRIERGEYSGLHSYGSMLYCFRPLCHDGTHPASLTIDYMYNIR